MIASGVYVNESESYKFQKSLYWLSEFCEWSLENDEANWRIRIVESQLSMEKIKSKLDQLLNDNLLREEHDLTTNGIRKEVIRLHSQVKAAIEEFNKDSEESLKDGIYGISFTAIDLTRERQGGSNV